MYQYIKSRPLQLCILGRNIQRRFAFRSIYQEVEKIETLVDKTNFEIEFWVMTPNTVRRVAPANWDREKLAEKLAHSNSCLIMLDI